MINLGNCSQSKARMNENESFSVYLIYIAWSRVGLSASPSHIEWSQSEVWKGFRPTLAASHSDMTYRCIPILAAKSGILPSPSRQIQCFYKCRDSLVHSIELKLKALCTISFPFKSTFYLSQYPSMLSKHGATWDMSGLSLLLSLMCFASWILYMHHTTPQDLGLGLACFIQPSNKVWLKLKIYWLTD